MIEAIDVLVLQTIQLYSSPLLDAFFRIVTELGNPVVWIAVAAYLFWKGREKDSFYLMNLVALSYAMAGFLKQVIAKPRPGGEFRHVGDTLGLGSLTEASGSSFPSGHTTLISAITSYSWAAAKRNIRILLVGILLLVAYSRMYLGAHYPSDVIGGIILGGGVGVILLWIKERTQHMHFKPSRLAEESALIVLVVVSVMVLFWFSFFALGAIFLGYYMGYAIYKELGAKQAASSNAKQLIGFIGLGAFGALFYLSNSAGQFYLYFLWLFLAGLWVSLLWPALSARLFTQPARKRI